MRISPSVQAITWTKPCQSRGQMARVWPVLQPGVCLARVCRYVPAYCDQVVDVWNVDRPHFSATLFLPLNFCIFDAFTAKVVSRQYLSYMKQMLPLSIRRSGVFPRDAGSLMLCRPAQLIDCHPPPPERSSLPSAPGQPRVRGSGGLLSPRMTPWRALELRPFWGDSEPHPLPSWSLVLSFVSLEVVEPSVVVQSSG